MLAPPSSSRASAALVRAAIAEEKAMKATDEISRREYSQLAASWRSIADTYEYVDRINAFLDRGRPGEK